MRLLLPMLLSSTLACFSDAPASTIEESASATTNSTSTTATGELTQTSTTAAPDTAGETQSGTDTTTESGPDLPDVDHCGVISDFGPLYGDLVASWTEEDDMTPMAAGGLVFVGSSSIRRWDRLAELYSDYRPIQRGLGGAQAGEIALWTDSLVNRHQPRGVVFYAGTNDIDEGVSEDDIIARIRCFRERVWSANGQALPVFFVGITPTPARWEQWSTAQAVNQAIQTLALDDPGLTYVDIPTAFLETGSPPAAELFAADELHLSAAGYGLWNSVLRPQVEAALPPLPPETGEPLPSGTRLLIDLGPSDQEHGEPTPSPDYIGQHWNNWYAVEGDAVLHPGEHRGALVTDDGTETSLSLVLAGGFAALGRMNGGLLWPSQDLLDDLAVGTATEDWFLSDTDDRPGALFLEGLSPAASYTLRLFASREEAVERITRYRVTGASSQTVTLQTSGVGAGIDGLGNDDDVAEVVGVAPDPWGRIFIDLEPDVSDYAYLGIVELVVE